MLGESGTEQFTVEVRVNGQIISTQKIHDPFVHTCVTTRLSRLECLKGLFFGKYEIRHTVRIEGSAGALRALMSLDAAELARDTEEILREIAISRRAVLGAGYRIEAKE